MWNVYAYKKDERGPLNMYYKSFENAERYCVSNHWEYTDDEGNCWDLNMKEVADDTEETKKKMYDDIACALSDAAEILSHERMMGLINDLGVLLDMHADIIRREVEKEYAEE